MIKGKSLLQHLVCGSHIEWGQLRRALPRLGGGIKTVRQSNQEHFQGEDEII